MALTAAGASATPAQRPPAGLKTVGQRLVTEAATGRFSGVVLIAKGATPVYAQAFGLADNAKATSS